MKEERTNERKGGRGEEEREGGRRQPRVTICHISTEKM